MSGDRLPRNLRRRAHAQALTVPRRQCWCGRPVLPGSLDGINCSEHDAPIGDTA